MNKSRIEWCDYTINPVKGLCPMACSYCYARKMYKRFKWNPEIRYEPKVLDEVLSISNRSRIFVGSTMELFGDWIRPEWMFEILGMVKSEPWHTFIFLTKQPQNLIKWSPFPQNVWLGVSVTTKMQFRTAIWKLGDIHCSKRFLSCEPLLEPVLNGVLPAEWDDRIDWVIIGQQTPVNKATMPKVEWVNEIVESADKDNIPIFLKYNLVGLLPIEEPFYIHNKDGWAIRQEFPK